VYLNCFLLFVGGAFFSLVESDDLELHYVGFANNTAGESGGSVYIGARHGSIKCRHSDVIVQHCAE
jgi:hypothetical protein